MAINPFQHNNCDLGVGDLYGYSRESATESLLRSQHSNLPKCYVCSNPAKYRYVAKELRYETATIQNGLYVCKHCLSTAPLSPKHYGIKELQ